MRRIIVGIILLCASMGASAQTGALQGHAFLGGTAAKTSGMNSSNYLDGIVPSATITVYLTGTTTKAAIYSDAASDPLANPFTANTASSVNPGGWIFWAATAQGYDIVASGGISPNTYLSPVTLCADCFASSQSTVTAGVNEIIPGTNITCSPESGGSCTGDVTVNASGAGTVDGDLTVTGLLTTGALSINAPPWSAPNGLAFIGDSLSAKQSGWQLQVPMITAQKIWTLNESWNPSVAGQTTAYMLATELPAILALSPKPNYVSILGGTNDYLEAVPLATTLSNITSMVNQLKAAGITPILNTVPPNNTPADATLAYAMNFGAGTPSSPTAPSIESTAATLGVAIVDNWSALADTGNNEYKAGYSDDGEHPNTYPGMTTMASNWVSSTNSIFATGTVWVPTTAQDRVNLVYDPLVSNVANWYQVQYSDFTTSPVFSSVSCSAVSAGSCFQAVITTDGNAAHYATWGVGYTSEAAAGDTMLMVLPYTITGMNALGGWSGGIAGLNVFTGQSDLVDPNVTPFEQLWYDCSNCVMAIEYTQPALPVSGNNVGMEIYFGGSTNSGSVTLQFGQAAVVDLTALGLPGGTLAFTQAPGTSTQQLATTAFVANTLGKWVGHDNVAVIGTDGSGNFLATPTTGTGSAVFGASPQITGAPQISVGGTYPANGYITPTGGGVVQANQIISASTAPAACAGNGFNVYFNTTTNTLGYCSGANTFTSIDALSSMQSCGGVNFSGSTTSSSATCSFTPVHCMFAASNASSTLAGLYYSISGSSVSLTSSTSGNGGFSVACSQN